MQKTFQYFLYSLFLAIIVLNPGNKSYGQQKKFKVVIDAGHGGHDSGTRGTKKSKIYEKDVVLAVALLVQKKLKKYAGIKPILTRKSDKFLELYQRAKIANKNKADLFISIHCNANKSSRPKGAETYVLGVHRNKANLEVVKRENAVIKLEKDNELHYEGFDPNHPESFIGLTIIQEEFLDQSILMASLMQKQFRKNGNKIKDRSVQKAGFAVLRLTYMPSVLTEIGFLSNPAEEKILHSKKGQDRIASAIVKAILAYKKYINYNTPTQDNTQEDKSTPSDGTKTTPKSTNKNSVIFKVQIAASKKKLSTKARMFKGLSDISVKRVDGWYKYYAISTSSYSKAKKVQTRVRKKGFKTAYIVAFKNGKRVKLSKLLKKK